MVARCYPRRVLLWIFPLLVATIFIAQQAPSEKQNNVSLTVYPPRIALNPGQTQKFSAHIEGAPTGTVIRWTITDGNRAGSRISQDGVFTAGKLGVYRVVAFATIGKGTVLKTAVAKVTVLRRLNL